MKHYNENNVSGDVQQSYSFGQNLNWRDNLVDVFLAVELPFWLMVPSTPLKVSVNNCSFDVQVRGDHYELHAGEFGDSRHNCIYLGPDTEKIDPSIAIEIDKKSLPTITRKCKTVLRIPTRCLNDVIKALCESKLRQREAESYLRTLAAAHISVVNAVIQKYRLATYDYFPYEVSPWDVPIWFIQTEDGHARIPLFPYREWDYKPTINDDVYTLISSKQLQNSTAKHSPGELDLIDALMLMEKGDYSGAIRRVTTAVEVLVDAQLRDILNKTYDKPEAEKLLKKHKNHFRKRVGQLEGLISKKFPKTLIDEHFLTRKLRHEIVHTGKRLSYSDRSTAQRCIDTSTWLYNKIENSHERELLREKKIALRSLGRFSTSPLFDAEITSTGARVYSPFKN